MICFEEVKIFTVDYHTNPTLRLFFHQERRLGLVDIVKNMQLPSTFVLFITLATSSSEVASTYALGARVAVTLFSVGQVVDVQGASIGKGFTGTIKRHNFSSQRASHGNSRSHNVPGSISMAQDPGRVFPGKKMSGHRGDATRTVQNLDVVRVDEVRQLLLVRGAVPGAKNGHVVVSPATKRKVMKGAK